MVGANRVLPWWCVVRSRWRSFRWQWCRRSATSSRPFRRGATVRVRARTGTREAECSSRMHSHYERRLSDTAVSGQELVIQLRVQRFFCRNEDCVKTTFVEQVPGLTVRYGRRSPTASPTRPAPACSASTTPYLLYGSKTHDSLCPSVPCPPSPRCTPSPTTRSTSPPPMPPPSTPPATFRSASTSPSASPPSTRPTSPDATPRRHCPGHQPRRQPGPGAVAHAGRRLEGAHGRLGRARRGRRPPRPRQRVTRPGRARGRRGSSRRAAVPHGEPRDGRPSRTAASASPAGR